MYKVGRTTGYYFEVLDESFEELRKGGMTAVELCYALERIYFEPGFVVDMAARHDVQVWSCHLPIHPFEKYDISSLSKETRQIAFDRYSEEIKKCAAVGIDKFVMHPGAPFEDESERSERIKCTMEFADALAEVAHKEGAVIAVEDMPHCVGRNIEELETILSANPKLRLCFDVNHLLENTHDEFIERLGDKIVTVHCSDYDFVEERHWFPTQGKIPWVSLMSKLYGSGYNGPWIYECATRHGTFKQFYDTAAGILKEAGVPDNL